MSLKNSASVVLFLILCCFIPVSSVKGKVSEKEIVLAQVQKFFDARRAQSGCGAICRACRRMFLFREGREWANDPEKFLP